MKIGIDDLLENTGDIALRRRAKFIIAGIDPKKNDKILDVGCGDGYYLHLLCSLRKDIHLTGLDIDSRAILSARRNLRTKKIKLIEADIEKRLPFRKNSFNKVIMSEVAEHLSDDVKGLSEVYRVLKPGGTLCLSVPNKNYSFLWDPISWFLEEYLNTHIKKGFWAGIWNQHNRLYDEEEIRDRLAEVGFKSLDLRSVTYWCLPFNHYIVNFGARILAKGKVPTVFLKGSSKFSKGTKRSFFVNLLYLVMNSIDKLNDIWIPRGRGVSIFVLATK